MILVSACLLGENCKYNGSNNYHQRLSSLLQGHEVITVCPEELGDLGTPRIPAEIVGGDGRDVLNRQAKVINQEGDDITSNFLLGANRVLTIAKKDECRLAILKERSPSCGSRSIYDGTFSGTKQQGVGVTTAILEKAGIKVYSEEDINQLKNII
ncbi:DUF523 domain-containing protein [Natroniella sulfidigena]|uniref:DUF523 domain-containing protein n=1 Tax=Natroniella sulfidigena TaxID=723921 RepID=UPI00200AB0DD|nr:DUF523 domain-containing protein [Natroniella sulfidigena]MCK8817929.1 DUF523 domain-containing protein [Natroniella sulfidigena]